MENKRFKLNKKLAQMLKGGVIMDVTTPEQAKIAEAAGACAVMALERIPADIRAAGGVSRMSDPKMIKGIQNAVNTAVNTLTENSKKVTCSDDIARVATISAADEVIGNLISEAMDKVTADGVITVEESKEYKSSFGAVNIALSTASASGLTADSDAFLVEQPVRRMNKNNRMKQVLLVAFLVMKIPPLLKN